MTPGESFSPGIERLQGSHSAWDGTTLGESFCPGMEQFLGSHSIPGEDSRGVIPSSDGTTPGESFSAGETHPVESFCPCIE